MIVRHRKDSAFQCERPRFGSRGSRVRIPPLRFFSLRNPNTYLSIAGRRRDDSPGRFGSFFEIAASLFGKIRKLSLKRAPKPMFIPAASPGGRELFLCGGRSHERATSGTLVVPAPRPGPAAPFKRSGPLTKALRLSPQGVGGSVGGGGGFPWPDTSSFGGRGVAMAAAELVKRCVANALRSSPAAPFSRRSA